MAVAGESNLMPGHAGQTLLGYVILEILECFVRQGSKPLKGIQELPSDMVEMEWRSIPRDVSRLSRISRLATQKACDLATNVPVIHVARLPY